MTNEQNSQYAALLLRVSLGTLLLAHAYLKLFVMTPSGVAKWFGSMGLPDIMAYGVIAFEVVGGVALLLGVLTRWIALIVVAEMIGTIYFVHGAKGWMFAVPGGGWEYPAFIAATALVLALLGDGAHSLSLPRRMTSQN